MLRKITQKFDIIAINVRIQELFYKKYTYK